MTKRERIETLLAERVTEGLPPEGEAELAGLLGGPADASPEAARWEATAAALALASLEAGGVEPLPPALARSLREDAELFVASARRDARKRAHVMTTGAASAAVLGEREGGEGAAAAGPRASGARWGWLAAAAAFALFAGQTWRLEAAGRAAASGAAAPPSTLHVTCSVEGDARQPVGELLWNAHDRQGVLVLDRAAGPAPGASGHVVYRCAPAAP